MKKKVMTLKKAVEMLQTYLDERLDSQGGYPAVVEYLKVPGKVIIADVDHDEAPTLTILSDAVMLRWARHATDYMKAYPEADVGEAMGECCPKEF